MVIMCEPTKLLFIILTTPKQTIINRISMTTGFVQITFNLGSTRVGFGWKSKNSVKMNHEA